MPTKKRTSGSGTSSAPDRPQSTDTMHVWRHKKDGRVRHTRPGTAADKRYARFPVWEKI